MKVKTSITLDESVLTKIDDLRGIVSRSAWINNELEGILADMPLKCCRCGGTDEVEPTTHGLLCWSCIEDAHQTAEEMK